MTKKPGRPAISVTKKTIGRLEKDRKGRMALQGDSIIRDTITSQDDLGDEDDNPGDVSDEESSETGSVVGVEQVVLAEEEEWVQESWDPDYMPPQQRGKSGLPYSALFPIPFIVRAGTSSFVPPLAHDHVERRATNPFSANPNKRSRQPKPTRFPFSRS
jgi:hypothetical protein